MVPVRVWHGGAERSLAELELPLPLERMVAGERRWEVELGFGKGAYLLRRAAEQPDDAALLGIEIVSRYYRMVRDRAARRGLGNVVLMRGEALYLICVALPRAFAAAVHVYFPDPWPKSRHHKRRLFEPESVDLVVGLLRDGGRLYVATDHLDYGEALSEVLDSHRGLEVEALDGPWPGGPRTNYEAKYVAEGRPIVRLVCRRGGGPLLHPEGRVGVLSAAAPRAE